MIQKYKDFVLNVAFRTLYLISILSPFFFCFSLSPGTQGLLRAGQATTTRVEGETYFYRCVVFFHRAAFCFIKQNLKRFLNIFCQTVVWRIKFSTFINIFSLNNVIRDSLKKQILKELFIDHGVFYRRMDKAKYAKTLLIKFQLEIKVKQTWN